MLTMMLAFLVAPWSARAQASTVRVKDLARVAGVRENPLTGYGLVFGLAGSGDSARNRATLQSVANTLRSYGVSVAMEDLSSRNVAAVIVTARLPAFAEVGQSIDALVSSAGDARSLAGGTLLLAPLNGPDGRVYAVAQGAVSVGGFQVEGPTASLQKNHPTVGVVPSGASIERAAPVAAGGTKGHIDIVLNEPDYAVADRIATALGRIPGVRAHADHAGKVSVEDASAITDPVGAIARLQDVRVDAERKSRVVVNERTGTVVAGGDVRLGAVTISQGDLRIEISTQYRVSQPDAVVLDGRSDVRTAVVPDTRIEAIEAPAPVVGVPEGATVADLLSALRRIRLPTRDVIAVLQSIKAAGALDGELVIQ